jgi:hypothetical protein
MPHEPPWELDTTRRATSALFRNSASEPAEKMANYVFFQLLHQIFQTLLSSAAYIRIGSAAAFLMRCAACLIAGQQRVA